jgi:hypothetical protein
MLKECADKDLLSSSNSLIVQRMISKTRKQSVARLIKANEVKDEIKAREIFYDRQREANAGWSLKELAQMWKDLPVDQKQSFKKEVRTHAPVWRGPPPPSCIGRARYGRSVFMCPPAKEKAVKGMKLAVLADRFATPLSCSSAHHRTTLSQVHGCRCRCKMFANARAHAHTHTRADEKRERKGLEGFIHKRTQR